MPLQSRDLVRKLAMLGVGIAVLLIAGAIAFAITEDVTVWNGFVWALDTVATVGSVPAPGDTAGEVVKVVLILLGVGTLFYALVTATELVVAGASQEESESKLRRAGADRVVSPYKASGTEMARLALHPNVTGALEVDAQYRLEEITVDPRSAGAGKPLADVRGGAF